MSDMNGAEVDPKSTATYKAAKAAVIVLSVLIVLALGGIIVGSAIKFSGKASAPVGPAVFNLPKGATIVSTQTDSGRLILRLRTDSAEEVDIIDLQSGKLIARIASE